MNLRIPLSFLLLLPGLAAADSQWVLDTSTLTYHVSHPLHQSEGVSHAARGKGICQDGRCNFLVAAPVKSFESRDTNRDLHMLQVTRGAQFPMVSVRVSLPEAALTGATIPCDVEIEFAGQKIANIYDYTYALDAVKIGRPVEIVIERDGQRVKLTVTPEARK